MKTQTAWCLSALVSSVLVSSCGWVDSTGEQGESVPVTEVFLDDVPVGNAIVLNEKVSARITAERNTQAALEQTFTWSDAPVKQGRIDSCNNQDGFNSELVADTLAQACTDPSQCALRFESVDAEDNVTEFQMLTPELQAPVGVTYELTVTDSDGRVNMREFDFCLVAINEAPTAENDTYSVLEGDRLIVEAGDNSLISNDQDDVDVSNRPLRVLPELLEMPESAAFFELNEDGSFIYESSLSGISSDQFDSFTYQLSDGVHVVSATATIRIIANNQAPEMIDELPVLNGVVGESMLENLALYFVDPEQSTLSFRFEPGAGLPDNGSLEMDSTGLITGIPAENDVGTYPLNLLISDGSATIEAGTTLMIESAPEPEKQNSAPVYVVGTVFNQVRELGSPIRPVEPEFIDPDGDPLIYSIANGRKLPPGVEIDEDTGIVSGTPEAKVYVRNIRIMATDPFGESATSGLFYIRVR